ncbi:MAG: hypothetical protein PHF74_06430 [Dehalococcoidales bacterium]|nr:hypothetical protein [Dehalococcoidales bacterium]
MSFSTKISDPAYSKYKKDSITWSFLFSFILFIIAVIGFPIYGNSTGELDWPESLFYGMGIGAMFITIAALQTAKRKLDTTWDGIVIDKQFHTKHSSNEYRTQYVIKIEKDSGKIKTVKWTDYPDIFNYYEVGDRVRHHKGLFYYEKYDKSRDSEILCVACRYFNDIKEDFCVRCKCPLLK